ncbi:MAG TPA: hypothetical protein VFB66_05450 [Tepidisphaeraceae bacterium]|nr:hypothetical protein [Tepidisphaeraceae bacterium]
MPTRAELAAELRLFASMLRRHADDPEAQAEAERLEVSARLIEKHGLLPDRTDARTMGHMQADSRELKIGKARAGDHPFPEALHAKGLTVTEWAEKQRPKLTREKVSSWYKPGKGGRRIPRAYAERILKDFGVPLASWPHGLKD